MKKQPKPTPPQLKDFVIIGKFDDGSYHQMVIANDTCKAVLRTINSLEKAIRFLENNIEGIEF